MNVASLELCMNLYTASGWTDTALQYYWRDKVSEPHLIGNTEEGFTFRGMKSRFTPDSEDNLYPAFDLGFLMRKLPFTTVASGPNDGKYAAWLATKSEETFNEADTPEDAVAMLATQLLKQGILTKEVK